jgi:hypothetical protein
MFAFGLYENRELETFLGQGWCAVLVKNQPTVEGRGGPGGGVPPHPASIQAKDQATFSFF